MGRIISFSSGKGGVGKTTVVANVGTALARLGQKTLIVDADIAMANLSILFGIHSIPITFQDVLLGEAEIYDAMYEGPYGVKVVPSGLSIHSYRRVSPDRISDVISSVEKEFDFVLIDVPAGIAENAVAAMSAAPETMIVVTPDPAALADALKVRITAERLNIKPIGAIINMVRGLDGEASPEEVKHILEVGIFGTIPDDVEVRKSFLLKKPLPVVARSPSSRASRAFMEIASKLAGVPLPKEEKKEPFLKRFIKSIFHIRKR